jgi:hypothetical protein
VIKNASSNSFIASPVVSNCIQQRSKRANAGAKHLEAYAFSGVVVQNRYDCVYENAEDHHPKHYAIHFSLASLRF